MIGTHDWFELNPSVVDGYGFLSDDYCRI